MTNNRKHSLIPVIILSVVLICLALCISDAYSQNQKTFLWRVQSKVNTVYLLGSIHFLKPDMYPLSDVIEEAFNKSDVLAVEADIRNENPEAAARLMVSGLYMSNDTLDAHISPETYDLVKEESAKLGLPIEYVRKQKPWFLGISTQALALMKAGYDPSYGIDLYFLKKAKEKKVIELEGLDYQLNLLAGFPEKEQELLLIYMLKDLDTMSEEVDALTGAWKSGDAAAVDRIMNRSLIDDKGLSPVYEKLIFARNRAIAAKIERYLKSKGTYFVVVGAAHLVGEKGIVQLLKDKGYSVMQQ